MFRKISRDRFPGFSKVRSLVDERIAVVHEVKIRADVGRGGIKSRRSDTGDRPQGWQPGNILRYICPICSAILGVPDLTVIRSCPDQTLLNFRRRDGEHNFAIKLAEVIADDSSGRNNVAGILRGQIGAGDRPVLTGVCRFENDLAALIDSVVVEGINGERRRPMAPVFYGVWR